jgi:ATP-dependent Clp protease ATP-binding subunit ClpA
MAGRPKGTIVWRADRRVHQGVAGVFGRPFREWFVSYMDAKAKEALLELVRLGGLIISEADLSEDDMKRIFAEAIRAKDRRLTGLHSPDPITVRIDRVSESWKQAARKYVGEDAVYALATLSVAVTYYLASKRAGEEKEPSEAVQTAIEKVKREKAGDTGQAQPGQPQAEQGQTPPTGQAQQGRTPPVTGRPAQQQPAEQGQTTPTTGRPAQPPKPAEQKPGEKA